VHTDHLNTPRKISQPSTGTLAWRYDSDPFGTAAPNQNPGGLGTFVYNLRAPGQYYQAETGLNQNVNRDYDPLTAKYIESDPLGLTGGVNTYAYVTDDPLWFVDPNGLLECTYVIASHILECTNNAGQFFATAAAAAGNGQCMNNPDCSRQNSVGPLPPGTYGINPPGAKPNHPTWLYLKPGKANDMQDTSGQNRNGFYIHPFGFSKGCIMLHVLNGDFTTVSDWATQDDGGTLHVVAEDF
jgi:RHS repeat-associated protein